MHWTPDTPHPRLFARQEHRGLLNFDLAKVEARIAAAFPRGRLSLHCLEAPATLAERTVFWFYHGVRPNRPPQHPNCRCATTPIKEPTYDPRR